MSVPARAGALAGFVVLAGYVSWHWFALIDGPPVARWVACLAIATTLAVALDRLGRARPGRAATLLLAALLAVAALAAGFLAAGVPARMLPPGGWDELRFELDGGLAGISQIDLPFAGRSDWTRIGILLAAPMALVAAAAVAFWPRGTRRELRRGIALTLLVTLYAISVTWKSPDSEILRGLGLFVAIAAFLWLGRLPASRALAAAGALLLAGLAALPAAARVDSSDPAINYGTWRIFGDSRTASFDWDHSYGPLDWPQRGTELFEAEGASRPLYWKTSVLDEFGGFGWSRGDGVAGFLIEDSETVGLLGATDEMVAARPEWVEGLDVSVLGLRSPLVVTTGTLQQIADIDAQPSAADGTTLALGDPIEPDTSYSFTAYAPDPSARLLRRRDDGHYPRALERYTSLLLPQRASETTLSPEAAPVGTLSTVTMPIRGKRSDDGSDPRSQEQRRLVAGTTYARVGALAERLTRDAPGNYEAVVAIERYLLDEYVYEQDVPEHARDPLVGFLFRDRAGYCQQFSGAMALMLRLAGIPSRVVSGFAPGLADPDREGTYLVRDTDAHSWVEVWFPRVGWVTVDPTPTAAPARTGTSAAPGTPLGLAGIAPGRAFEIEESAQSGPIRGLSLPDGGRDEGGSPLVGLAWLTAILAVTGLIVTYRRRRGRLLAPEGAAAQLRELERAFPLVGAPARPGLTLLGIERAFEAELGPGAAAYPAALRANRYGRRQPRRPGPHERRQLRRALGRGRGIHGRLRALRMLPPGGPAPGLAE